MEEPEILFVEDCDFESFPAGGQLAMARSLIKVFGSRWALVGLGGPDAVVGRWCLREIGGATYHFFPVCRSKVRARRPLIPARLAFYLGLRRFQKRILATGCKCVFTQSMEALLVMSRWDMESICYMFPGLENPLRISRYGFIRWTWPLLDQLLFGAIRKADLVVACADEQAIENFVYQSHGRVSRESIVRLPTCVDMEEFLPMPMRLIRNDLGISERATVVATCGRIGWIKGWDLLLQAFALFRNRCSDAMLIFIGDGEDRPLLEASIEAQRLSQYIRITGFQTHNQIVRYLNAANVIACASHIEGWSVAMLEALACGNPLVSTNVSGVKNMILQGRNGFVVESRDPTEFARALENALALGDVEHLSRSIANEFSLSRLQQKLRNLWPPLHAHPVLPETENFIRH